MIELPERTYTCEGCGATFTGTYTAAFDLGWDTPERFMSHCTCPNCPINTTIWWKLAIEHQTPTEDEIALIRIYNEQYFEANPHMA